MKQFNIKHLTFIIFILALFIFGCEKQDNIIGVDETDVLDNQIYYCLSVKILNSQGIIIDETITYYSCENWNDYSFKINKQGQYSIVCCISWSTDRVCSAFWSISKANWFTEYSISKPGSTSETEMKDNIYFEDGTYNIKMGILEI